MERWTGYKEKDLKEALEDVKQFAMEVNPKFLSTLKYKFQKPEYKSVASIPFNFQWEKWNLPLSVFYHLECIEVAARR